MILADKIINLRKKAGWSQEDLAAEMGVSRQSVSKWEGAQSIPEMDKILKLSEIFGVSTDILLKDDLDLDETEEIKVESASSRLRKVSLEDANRYIKITRETSKRIALGVVLCILSPVLLLLTESDVLGIFMNYDIEVVQSFAVVFLLLMIATAVGLFIMSSLKNKEFEFLSKEDFETAYGVDGMVKERKQEIQTGYYMRIVISVGLFILSATPVLLVRSTFSAVITLCMIALGVYILAEGSMNYSILEKLLKTGDYTKETKASNKVLDVIASFYWPIVTIIFLWTGFVHGSWGSNWMIWPIAGVLFGAISASISSFNRK